MVKYKINEYDLCAIITKSYKSKKIRNWLIDNCFNIEDEKIDIHIIKLINDHPTKKFKETFLSLLGHKKLSLNVLIYIASLGYYPESFYSSLIIRCDESFSLDSLIDFLNFNVKYILETEEFINSINYMQQISDERKKIIFEYVKKINN